MFGQPQGHQSPRQWFSLSLEIPGVPLRQVWELIQPAEHAPSLNPDVVDARTEGPEGVGQVQLFVHAHGDERFESRVEITHHDPPWVTECRDLDTPFPSGTRCELRDLPIGTLLSMHVWAEPPYGAPPPDRAAVLASMESYLVAVRRQLAAPPPQGFSAPRPVPPPNARQYSRAHHFFPGVTPERLWATIRPAEAALFDPNTIEAYTEPGTGPGIGEIQVCVRKRRRKRDTQRVLIVDEHPPFFATTRNLTQEWMGTTYRVVEVDGGTRLHVDLWMELPPGYAAPEADREHAQFTSNWFAWLERTLAVS